MFHFLLILLFVVLIRATLPVFAPVLLRHLDSAKLPSTQMLLRLPARHCKFVLAPMDPSVGSQISHGASVCLRYIGRKPTVPIVQLCWTARRGGCAACVGGAAHALLAYRGNSRFFDGYVLRYHDDHHRGGLPPPLFLPPKG